MAKSKSVIAFLGLAGWYENGTDGPNCTWSRTAPGGLPESELTAPIRVDLRPVLEKPNPVAGICRRPSLDLSLPVNNVRELFEGCIGFEGSTKGHRWNRKLESLNGSDSVGLNVYLALLQSQGAIVTRL